MVWHYIENGQQAGPVDEATFQSLVSSGKITGNTHVWREGMPDWVLYSTIASSPAGGGTMGAAGGTALAGVAGGTQCSECGNYFPADDLVQIGERTVCAACKPISVQKLKEGVVQNVVFEYSGFWMRVLARIVDSLIMIPVYLVYIYIVVSHPQVTNPVRLSAQGMNFVVALSYSVFFIGRFGSTPGMMTCGIRVVRPDGQKVSYLRALGRYFADVLAVFAGAIILAIVGAVIGGLIGAGAGGHTSTIIGAGIGGYICALIGASLNYIVVAFDGEKRAIHDRICDTRTVYKK